MHLKLQTVSTKPERGTITALCFASTQPCKAPIALVTCVTQIAILALERIGIWPDAIRHSELSDDVQLSVCDADDVQFILACSLEASTATKTAGSH